MEQHCYVGPHGLTPYTPRPSQYIEEAFIACPSPEVQI
jgi:hypothetical protein